jgi:hypothetical protein
MKLSSFEAIVQALNGAQVRFIVVGGLAVNAHGYIRVTNDVGIVIRLYQSPPSSSPTPRSGNNGAKRKRCWC